MTNSQLVKSIERQAYCARGPMGRNWHIYVGGKQPAHYRGFRRPLTSRRICIGMGNTIKGAWKDAAIDLLENMTNQLSGVDEQY